MSPSSNASLRQMRHRRVIRLVPALILMACSGGTEPDSINVSGEWVMTIGPMQDPLWWDVQYMVDSASMRLIQGATVVEGTIAPGRTRDVNDPIQPVPPPGFAYSISGGTLRGDSIIFDVYLTDYLRRFRGRVTGNTMAGTVDPGAGSQPAMTGPWMAVRR